MGQSLFQDSGCRRVLGNHKAIVHPATLPARSHDACPTQVSQMTRDFWLADPQNVDEIADADLFIGNQVQEAKPSAVGKGAE
jgi:hypothetical protein